MLQVLNLFNNVIVKTKLGQVVKALKVLNNDDVCKGQLQLWQFPEWNAIGEDLVC